MADPYKLKWNPETGSYDTSLWDTDQWSQFGSSGGTVGANGELIPGGSTTGLTAGQLTPTSSGLLGMGTTSQWDTALGLGGLAMKAIALPQQMQYYGAQTDLAKQQLASNQQAMADRKTFNANWANASNGLAGRASQVV